MGRRTILAAATLLAAIAAAGAAGALFRPAEKKAPPPAKDTPAEPRETKKESEGVAEVRKTAAAYTAAFNKGDAKAAAALWEEKGEYVGPDGETLRGRAAIEKAYVEFFKKNPKATIEVVVGSVRLLGTRSAVEEGTLRLRLPGEKEPGESRYSVLHVREDDGWRMARVREWVPDESERNALEDIAWLVGEWSAKTKDTELRARYAWDEDKKYLRCRYTLKEGDKTVSSGTQIIAREPAGGLRSWLFDGSGTFGESTWVRDGDRWVLEASGTLPDGTVLTALNIIIPLGKDAFTWQSVERTAGDTPLPDLTPLKVTRVKADR
jgi:uncharacterized protein (TIGR02246 family)